MNSEEVRDVFACGKNDERKRPAPRDRESVRDADREGAPYGAEKREKKRYVSGTAGNVRAEGAG